MKKFALPLSLFISVFTASAQVEVEVVVSQDKFLPAEELIAGIRILNRSGQTLRLGEDADWVKFIIEKPGGGVVHQISQPPVGGAFEIESTDRITMRVDLAPCYELRQQGRYLISANVRIKEWNQTLSTKPVAIEIVEGTELGAEKVGVPRPGQPPEMRKYTLHQANYLKDQLRLYLRVSDSSGHVLKMINVGPMISFGAPDWKIDKQSRIHLLYQNSNRRFAYLVVNPDGEIQIRQTHEYGETRPRLQTDNKGGFSVAGGEQRITPDDLPRVKVLKDDGTIQKP